MSSSTLGPTRVAWSAWSRAAFDEANASHKLVLLWITAPWCATCAEVESVEFARGDVAGLVRDRFVPIRVDACARPDISDRYVAEAWPTIACLTPDGEPLNAAAPTSADEILAVLRRASDAYDTHGEEIHARIAERRRRRRSDEPPPGADIDPRAADAIVYLAAARFDAVHGGFGDGPKIPHAALVRLLIARADRDERCRMMAERTLDAVATHLRDPLDGGFFRAAHRRDWSDPDAAKLIEVNAELIELFVDAGERFGEARYLDIASGALGFVEARFEAGDGGFAPDRTLYTDANAMMAHAYLRAAAALGARRLTEYAVQTLERVAVAGYKPGAGVAHDAADPASVRGLLTDQVHCAWALAASAAAAGIVPHLMLAEELMGYADRTMRDAADGRLRDRIADEGDIGLLREPLKPFALNCHAARVWSRLAALAAKPEYAGRAIAALASQTPFVADRALFAAPYGIAVEEA